MGEQGKNKRKYSIEGIDFTTDMSNVAAQTYFEGIMDIVDAIEEMALLNYERIHEKVQQISRELKGEPQLFSEMSMQVEEHLDDVAEIIYSRENLLNVSQIDIDDILDELHSNEGISLEDVEHGIEYDEDDIRETELYNIMVESYAVRNE